MTDLPEPGGPAPADTPLRRAVAEAFAAGGKLSRADPLYRPRGAQATLADAVARALDERSALVAEAGTGVGKTFAYLVPLLQSGARALVSTATKSLQDQLYTRDLPTVARALGMSVNSALLKGRSSYLCLHRMQQAEQEATFADRGAVRALAKVLDWAPVTRTGDLSEIEGLDERSPVIPLVTSTRENCLGTECPRARDCHVLRARREAMLADVVVVNHHLFFADLVLRDTGMAELLPSVDAVVFDEAHQLTEAGVQFLGVTLGTAQIIDFARDLLSAGLSQAKGLRPWQEIAGACERAARDLRLAVDGRQVGASRLAWESKARDDAFLNVLEALRAACAAAGQALADVADASPDLARLAERARECAARAARFTLEAQPGLVRWIDLSSHHARLVESPLDIREAMQAQLESTPRTWVFTSATLGHDERLTWFTRSAGLDAARVLRVGSPFDYEHHARLYVPRRFPRPNEATHAHAVADLAARCATRLGGRTFVLTTTLRALQAIGQRLRDQLESQSTPVRVLIQGEWAKRALLERFRTGGPAVLVGSQTFWEGIDVAGSALQCVVIDKLPFPPPNDPLVEARTRRIESDGGNPFNDYFVPEAAVSLKQGAGRLIRRESDMGLLVVCDPRMATMGYGGRIRQALPPMPVLDDLPAVDDWLEELRLAAIASDEGEGVSEAHQNFHQGLSATW